MKEIFALLLVLSVVNAGPFLGALRDRPLGKLFHPAERRTHSLEPLEYSCGPPEHRFIPPGHSFVPPGHSFIPPGHSFIPPGHRFTPPGHTKRHLFPFNAKDTSCSAACICRNPETDDITITGSDGSQIIIKKATQQDETSDLGETHDYESLNNGGFNQGDSTNVKPNSENGNRNNRNVNKGNTGTLPAYTPTQQPETAESPRYHGGEGVIDIRMAS